MVPEKIGSAADLPVLIDALRGTGYSEVLLMKIDTGNWLDLLARTIG